MLKINTKPEEKPIVEIEWLDACHHAGTGNLKYIEKNLKGMLVRSVGYMLPSKDKDVIKLSTSYYSNEDYGDVLCIPIPWFKKIIILRNQKKK